MPRRIFGVANPRGGAGRAAAVAEQVQPVFAGGGAELEVHFTEHAGHATELAKTADLAGYDGICVVGGDGTTHEVVEGLMQRADEALIPLGLIPAGTGNTLHHHLACGDPIDAAKKIVQGSTRSLDVVRVTMGDQVVHSVNIVGWGAVADINRRAEQLRMLGTSRYALAALIQILLPKRRRATIVLDDDEFEDEFLFVLACNTKSTGAGMLIAPDAEVDDGLLDVVVLRMTSRVQTFKLFRKVFDGSHLSLPCVEYRQVKSLTVKAEDSGPLNIDGEMKGAAPFVAEVMAGALEVFH